MTAKYTVDIGIACSAWQAPGWWTQIMADLIKETARGDIEIGQIIAISSALPDHRKNETVGLQVFAPEEEKRRNELTDANRSTISKRFMDGTPAGKSEWLFQIDDDTVPPQGALHHLLGLNKPFVAGLYYLPKPPFNPIAYVRRQDGGYQALYDVPFGSLIQVDSVGMGCTLIHRSVFEKIAAEHTVFVRPNLSLVAIHNSKIQNISKLPVEHGEFVRNGVLHTPLAPVKADDHRMWPFYSMEYGRTEDHHFCELAAAVGIKPWVDTTVNCEHWKNQPTTRDVFLSYARENIT